MSAVTAGPFDRLLCIAMFPTVGTAVPFAAKSDSKFCGGLLLNASADAVAAAGTSILSSIWSKSLFPSALELAAKAWSVLKVIWPGQIHQRVIEAQSATIDEWQRIDGVDQSATATMGSISTSLYAIRPLPSF